MPLERVAQTLVVRFGKYAQKPIGPSHWPRSKASWAELVTPAAPTTQGLGNLTQPMRTALAGGVEVEPIDAPALAAERRASVLASPQLPQLRLQPAPLRLLYF